MPVSDKRINDYFAETNRQMRLMQQAIRTLKAKQLSMAPDFQIADGYGSGIGVDYQIAIDTSDDSFKYHSNGAWHTAGGITEIDTPDSSILIANPNGPTVDVSVNMVMYTAYGGPLTVPAISLGTPGSVPVDWSVTHQWSGSGADPFDYTDPVIPTFINSGNVIIAIQLELDSGDPPPNAGTYLVFGLQSPAPTGTGISTLIMRPQSVLDSNGVPTGYLQMSSVTNVAPGQGINAVAVNSDTVDHNVLWRVDLIQFVGA